MSNEHLHLFLSPKYEITSCKFQRMPVLNLTTFTQDFKKYPPFLSPLRRRIRIYDKVSIQRVIKTSLAPQMAIPPSLSPSRHTTYHMDVLLFPNKQEEFLR
jgi:hypothetical protein